MGTVTPLVMGPDGLSRQIQSDDWLDPLFTGQNVGDLRETAATVAPPGWLFCDGSVLPIASYPALFATIGSNFGGDGTTTFALPYRPASYAPADVSGTAPSPAIQYIIAFAGRYGFGNGKLDFSDPSMTAVALFAGVM